MVLLTQAWLRPGAVPAGGKAVILSSLKIRPYERLVDHMREDFRGTETAVFFLDQDPQAADRVPKMKPSAILTVGQEALRQALPLRGETPLVFTMVLFPKELLRKPVAGVSGIAMIPSPRHQLQIIHAGLKRNHVAIFYNPEVTGFLAEHMAAARPPGMTLDLVPVTSEADLLRRLDEGLAKADALLLIPDPTVLTEQGLKALVSASYLKQIPIVGFSPMYLEMGATVTLSVQEEEVAKEAVLLTFSSAPPNGDTLDGVCYLKSCEIRVNAKAISKLGLSLDRRDLEPLGSVVWSESP